MGIVQLNGMREIGESCLHAKLTVVTGDSDKIKGRGTKKRTPINNGSALTDKQEAFVMGIFSGENYSSAYRAAYDTQNMSDGCIHTEACLLAQNPKVTKRLEQLYRDKEQERRMQSLSRGDFVLEQLKAEATNPDNSDGARVRALELLGKSVALFTDKVETQQVDERDAEAIKAELQRKLDSLLG